VPFRFVETHIEKGRLIAEAAFVLSISLKPFTSVYNFSTN